MEVNYNRQLRGSARAQLLGLNSSRFHQPHISKRAKEAIEQIKLKDRSYLKLHQWRIKNYYRSDATLQLKDQCPNMIQRRSADELSIEQFIEQYQKTFTPLIITGCTKDWNLSKWSFQSFYTDYKECRFKIGEDDQGYKLRAAFKHYLEYLVYNKDDSPLYLFQSSVEDHKQANTILNNYTVPKYFQDDLFKLAGEHRRPPYRWFIMGAQRSGTTVHVDPLHTSAWNASLAGYKRWVCFSPHVPKTIAKGKQFRRSDYQDQAINYFVEILPLIKQTYSKEELGLIEFIQGPGQTVFIPGGMWHAVINVTDTIAVTQNVMTHYNFTHVWKATRRERSKFAVKFLEDLKAQVSISLQRMQNYGNEPWN